MKSQISIKRRKGHCPHGRPGKARCKECLGHSPYKDKCPRCCKRYVTDRNDKKINGKPLATCLNCRVKSKCTHGETNIARCKICIQLQTSKYKCKHNKRPTRCVICNGSELCKSHHKFKSVCRDCGGSRFCSHGRQRHYCFDCGTGLCP